ncbi:MAG: hypothetical protein BKP49_03340 [Treponema sp. CETP13]|nr:MAG: hypothetical protein BKP49_03340 [Treponema sp. CETP13]
MYNILLTDDEQIVIDSLKFIIEKNFPNQFRLITSLSGSEAVSISRTQKIDIMFMDINMPGLNGLEAINEIKKCNPEIVIIILSAFDRFKYAQQAIELGAFKYLTKPVNRKLIIETVHSAVSLLIENRGKMAGDIEMREKLNFVSSIVESDFIYSCVFGSGTGTELQDYLDYFKITAKKWFFCCIEFPRLAKEKRYDTYLKLHDVFSSYTDCILGSFILNRITIFIPLSTDIVDMQSTQNMRKSITDLMQPLYSKLAFKFESDIRLGVSSEGSDLNFASVNYNEALLALDRTPMGGGIVFAFGIEEDGKIDEYGGATQVEILSRLQAGDVSEVRSKISMYCKKLFNREDGDINRAKNALFELMIEARGIVTRLDCNYKNNAFNTVFSILSSTNDRDEIEKFVQQRFSECVVAVKEIVSRKENPLIKRTCEYIHDHLSEVITLEQMADLVAVSPYYLSKLFKDVTGENFISYITSLRLEEGRTLLANQSLSIKEISHAIGYNDQNYFSKIFRKKFNMTPTEYRNSLL